MATHRYHPDPDTNDPADAVLWDDCERCEEHAQHPHLTLDNENLVRLWYRMLAAERDGDGRYLTATESRAGFVLHGIALFLERHTNVALDQIR